jgi:hypothetical protein
MSGFKEIQLGKQEIKAQMSIRVFQRLRNDERRNPEEKPHLKSKAMPYCGGIHFKGF